MRTVAVACPGASAQLNSICSKNVFCSLRVSVRRSGGLGCWGLVVHHTRRLYTNTHTHAFSFVKMHTNRRIYGPPDASITCQHTVYRSIYNPFASAFFHKSRTRSRLYLLYVARTQARAQKKLFINKKTCVVWTTNKAWTHARWQRLRLCVVCVYVMHSRSQTNARP